MSTAVERAESLHIVQLTLCEPCLDGEGGECHTPGCAMWLNRAPDLSLHDKVTFIPDGYSETQYGNKYTYHDEVDPLPTPGPNEYAVWVSERHGYPLYKRTVTYGPWMEVSGDDT